MEFIQAGIRDGIGTLTLAAAKGKGLSARRVEFLRFLIRMTNPFCGIVALKPEYIRPHAHLGPWVAAGFVLPLP
jgi:hypothetical protein